ncbi:putative glycylpeptide n-tetradecanoyltransferase protein, variant 2 [Balamuthia mandrillaris]
MADEDGSTTTQQEVAASPCCPSSEQQATQLKAEEIHYDAKEKAKAKENDSTNEGMTPPSQKSMTTSRPRRKPFRATSFHRERSWNLPHSEMFAKHDHCPALALRTFSHRLKVGERRGSPCTLCYQLFGHGPKKLLFIMGYVTSSQVWAEQVAYFAQPELGFQVCIFDNRGYPSSPSHRSMCFPTMEEYAKDTLELLDHLGWSLLHLVGFSMGFLSSLLLLFFSLSSLLFRFFVLSFLVPTLPPLFFLFCSPAFVLFCFPISFLPTCSQTT